MKLLRKLGLLGGGGNLPRGKEGCRAYAIGDIHGRLDLLDKLLAKIEELARRAAGGLARGEPCLGLVELALQALNLGVARATAADRVFELGDAVARAAELVVELAVPVLVTLGLLAQAGHVG